MNREELVKYSVFLSIGLFCVSTLESAKDWIILVKFLQTLVTLVFVSDLYLRIKQDGVKYLLTFWGVIDVVSCIPTHLLGASAGPLVKSVILIRLIKLSKSQKLVYKAMMKTKQDLEGSGSIFILFVFSISTSIYMIEHAAGNIQFSNMFESIWWTITTMTTVGYGDAVPGTAIGKLIAAITMIVGVGVLAIPAGLLTANLTKLIRKEAKNQS